MDFAAMAQDELRREVRAVLAAPDVRVRLDALLAARAAGEREPDPRELFRALGARGVLAPSWPAEYGGRGGSLALDAAAFEELVRAGVPETVHVNTVQIVGLTVLLFGTAQQRRRWLPRFAAGTALGCVVYTEPEAGSDLAALRTTATVDGDGFRLDGVKVYSVRAGISDVALCAARTGTGASKYQGITVFLVDLANPGVLRTPLPSSADEAFWRVEFAGVRVGREAVLGEIGNGWSLLDTALAVERSGLDYALKAERWLAAAATVVTAEPRPDTDVLIDIGRYGAAVEAARARAWAVLDEVGTGRVDPGSAALSKYTASELAREIGCWAPTVLGAARAAGPAAAVRTVDSAYREAPGVTLSAGTSEVMLQIAAGPRLDRADTDLDPVREQVRRLLRARLVPPTDPQPPADVDDTAWTALARLGVPGFELPIELGGLDLGAGLGVVVAEELGRATLPGHYVDTTLAADAFLAGGARSPAVDPARLATGELPVTALGLADPAGDGGLTARPTGTGWSAGGRLPDPPQALDGPVLLPLRDAHTLLIALIPADRVRWTVEEGVAVLDDLPVYAEDLLCRASIGAVGGGLDELLGPARVRQAGWLAGLAAGALAGAVSYASRRRQSGQRLRDFQTIGHRLAAALAAVESARIAVRRAAWALDIGAEDAAATAVDALALAADTALAVTPLTMQVQGAQGMTGRSTAHRYFQLAATEAVRFGTPRQLWRRAGRRRLAPRRSPAATAAATPA